MAIRPDPDFEADVAALMDGLHLDHIDKKRVPPTVFRVGLVVRDLGLGGTTGWGIPGLALGIVLLEKRGLGGVIGTSLAGVLD